MDALFSLYAPTDARRAFELYGATCGPCAFAALIRSEVRAVTHHFPALPDKQFTNVPMMLHAIRSAGLRYERVDRWPTKGFVLYSGPERYHSRHWLAVEDSFVYEVSLDTWLPHGLWISSFLPRLAAAHQSQPSEWFLETCFEVIGHPQAELGLLGGESLWGLEASSETCFA